MKLNGVIDRGATFLLAACIAVLLNSCGSGAVSAPPAPDPAKGTPLAVSPPAADLFPDLPTTFTITGGTSGYTAFSSNSAVLPVTATVTGATFSVVPNAVPADTVIDITVRDAVNASATAKVTVKPSSLLNQITFTPFGPTANGCGTNALCSGGDAQIFVKAVQNGVVLRNRPIRFDAFKGDFQLVLLATGERVSSLIVNTDEQGEASARITANIGAATQVATIQTTDITSGLSRRYNFNIVQQTSGAGILSTLPSSDVTITGAKGTPGADGSCPIGATVDYYIFGGTPTYTVVSPLPGVASVTPGIVGTNGGRFTAQVTGCGKVAFIITDATGRTIETSSLISVQGAKGDAITTPPSLNVNVTSLTIACGASGSVTVGGSGTYTTTIVGTIGGLFVTPSADTLTAGGASVTIAVNRGSSFSNPRVDFVNGSITKSVAITVTTSTPGTCP